MASDQRTASLMRLSKFLEDHRAIEGQCTHVSPLNPKGSYTITDNNTFLELYNDAINNGVELYFSEMCEPIGSPFRIDIDLKFVPQDFVKTGLITYEENNYIINQGHTYDSDLIVSFIYHIKQKLEELIDLTQLDHPFYVVILEKDRPSHKSNNLIGDGFHLIFPYLITTPALQHFVRNHLIQSSTFNKIFGSLPYQNEPEDIYDKGIIDRNWTLYGSRGKCGGALYTITEIYELKKKPTIREKMIRKRLSIDNLSQTVRSNLPKFLSVRGKQLTIVYKSESIEKLVNEWHWFKRDRRKCKKPIESTSDSVAANDQLVFVRKLLNIVSPRRSYGYDDWIRMGWCLHNIDKSLLDDFVAFSQQCQEKFDPQACEKVWEDARDDDGGLGIGTLHFWAKSDNPEEYARVLAEETTRQVDLMPETHVGIAEMMKKMYENEFICVQPQQPIQKRQWFHFEHHRWVPNAVCDLRDKIYSDVISCFKNTRLNSKKLSKICAKLETSTFIDGVIKECGYKLHRRDFPEIANANSDLIGFNNGVYDLRNMVFREGFPDDFITMTTGIDYNPNTPETKDVKKFLKEILPRRAVREYTLFYMATCLQGDNEQQKLVVFTGEGGNGKSKLIQLLEESLGDYACALDVAYVTQKRQRASQASPGVMELRNRRLAVIHEPDEGDTLNMGIIKALTGNDKIKARNLFENDITFRNRAKLIMLCNALPNPSSQDDGVWRRIRAVHFPVQFVENPVEPHERKKDPELDTKILTWKQAFVNILLEYYERYRIEMKGVIQEPKEVKDFTDEYRQRTNIFLEFSRDLLIEDHEQTDELLSTNKIFQKFRSWHQQSYPGNKCPPKKELQDFLKKAFKKKYTIAHGLKGYIFADEIEVEKADSEDCDQMSINESKDHREPSEHSEQEVDLLDI